MPASVLNAWPSTNRYINLHPVRGGSRILESNNQNSTRLAIMKTTSASSDKDVTEDKIEDIGVPALNNVDYDEEYSPNEQRKIIHRIDRRLVTITGLSYCISLMDRTNLSMAAVAGYVLALNTAMRN